MKFRKNALLGLIIVSVSACAEGPNLLETSRGDTTFLVEPVAIISARERAVTQEAVALEDSIRAILKNAQSPMGACNGTLSDPAMAQCSERDLMGRTLGALRSTLGANQPLDLNALAPAITQTLEDLTTLETGINAMLLEQSEEMDLLEAERLSNQLTEEEHRLRLSHMQQSRIAIAEALALSADRARQTRGVLEKAQASGASDYSWFIGSMIEIESRTASAGNRLAS